MNFNYEDISNLQKILNPEEEKNPEERNYQEPSCLNPSNLGNNELKEKEKALPNHKMRAKINRPKNYPDKEERKDAAYEVDKLN